MIDRNELNAERMARVSRDWDGAAAWGETQRGAILVFFAMDHPEPSRRNRCPTCGCRAGGHEVFFFTESPRIAAVFCVTCRDRLGATQVLCFNDPAYREE